MTNPTLITLVVGLPASGKSSYINKLSDSLGAIIIDDPRDFFSDVVFRIQAGKPHFIADCHFCLPNVRKNTEVRLKWEVLMCEIRHIFFENNPDQCLKNLARRIAAGDERTAENMIKQLSPHYAIPDGVTAIPVWSSHD